MKETRAPGRWAKEVQPWEYNAEHARKLLLSYGEAEFSGITQDWSAASHQGGI